MSLWVFATLVAAFAQTVRFVLQKHLANAGLSVNGATFARFVFSLPIVTLLVLGYVALSGATVPALSGSFLVLAALGGLLQMLATVCVVATFKLRNFSIGVTFKKTEVMQSAIIGLVFLGDLVSFWGWVALAIGLVGVLILSDPPTATGPWRTRIFNKAAGLGLLSGLLFALCGVSFRAALIGIEGDDVFLRAMFTLALVTGFQTLVLGLWLHTRERGEIARVVSAWRVAAGVGLAGMIGSLGWFTAFAEQTVAYVTALGQVELIFTLIASIVIFREKAYVREFLGVAVLMASILILVLAV